jgi:hypothetical protein
MFQRTALNEPWKCNNFLNSVTVLGSQLFSRFWIGWMIEHPTKSNSKNPKKLDIQSTFNVKNPKKLYLWIVVRF